MTKKSDNKNSSKKKESKPLIKNQGVKSKLSNLPIELIFKKMKKQFLL